MSSRRVERQRGGRVDDEVDALHRRVDVLRVADVAGDDPGVTLQIAIGELGDIERDEPVTARAQVAEKIDAEKARTAGHEDRGHGAARLNH